MINFAKANALSSVNVKIFKDPTVVFPAVIFCEGQPKDVFREIQVVRYAKLTEDGSNYETLINLPMVFHSYYATLLPPTDWLDDAGNQLGYSEKWIDSRYEGKLHVEIFYDLKGNPVSGTRVVPLDPIFFRTGSFTSTCLE